MKIASLIVSCLLISALVFSQATGRLVLNKGQKLEVETKGNSVMTQEMMGQSMEITADIKSISSLEVKEATNEKYNLTSTLTKMKMNMSLMGQDMNFDSDKKEDLDGEMGAGFKNVLNKPKDMMVNGLAQTIPDTSTKAGKAAPEKNPMEAMMAGILGSSGEDVNPAFEIIPASAVKGYSWIDSTTSPELTRITTYIVKDIKGNEAIVVFDGTVNTVTTNDMQGMPVKTTQAGTIKGEMLVDVATGILKEKKTTIESKGTLEMMGQQVPMTSKLSFTTTVKSM